MRFQFFLFIILLLFSSLSSAWANKRIALVIGNGDYKNISALSNPSNDAKAIAKTLRSLNFDVIEKHNLNRRQMAQAIHQFGQKLGNGKVGLFYYAGHGVQIDGKNYLLPLDAPINSKDEVPYETINVDRVLSKMETSGNSLNIMILDACRNNPFKRRSGFRSVDRGLALVDAPTGSIIIYATAPGEKAADGKGENGLFTKHLLKNMVRPQLDVELMLRDTRYGVMKEAKRLGYEQVPWSTSSLFAPFCFAGCGKEGLPPVSSVASTPEDPVPATRSQPVIKQRLSFEPDMVFIKGGRFQMGSPASEKERRNDEKQHTVQVKDFWIGKTEVTFAQWEICVKMGGCLNTPADEGWGRGQHPVINISWNDAWEYVQWLNRETKKNYRLPTEAEWEYAARAGTTTVYPWGDDIECHLANYDHDYQRYCKKKIGEPEEMRGTKVIASYQPYGDLYDMQGNVSEWTCSTYKKNYSGAESECISIIDRAYRIAIRGGSWYSYARGVRSANRAYYWSDARNNNIGFRLALDKSDINK